MLPELSALFFPLCGVVSAQTKAPERTYIYNPRSLQTAKEDAVHQSGPKGADILISLTAVQNKTPLSGLKRHQKRKRGSTTWTSTALSSLPSRKPGTWFTLTNQDFGCLTASTAAFYVQSSDIGSTIITLFIRNHVDFLLGYKDKIISF